MGQWLKDREAAQMAQIRGLRVLTVEVEDEGELFLIEVPQVCQYLTAEGLCKLHPDLRGESDEDLPERPDFCNRYPEEPAQLILTGDFCGFRFEEVSE